MDLLYQRYADPFSFIENMIRSGRFNEFVAKFVKTINEEKEEKANWDVWLHKVFEGTYQEFLEGIETSKDNQDMTEETILDTVKYSMNILNNFSPDEGGEVTNGIV